MIAAQNLHVAHLSCRLSYMFGGVHSLRGNLTFGKDTGLLYTTTRIQEQKGGKNVNQNQSNLGFGKGCIRRKQSKHECSKGSLWEGKEENLDSRKDVISFLCLGLLLSGATRQEIIRYVQHETGRISKKSTCPESQKPAKCETYPQRCYFEEPGFVNKP